MKTKRYCYRSVSFPEEAYVGYVTILKNEQILMFYPLDQIFASFDEYQKAAKKFTKEFSIQDLAVSDTGLLMPIVFTEKFPLKREYWQEPTISYTTQQRVKLFAGAANVHMLYKLLVTPSSLVKRPALNAAATFYTSATPAHIETFMYTSDFPVDETAKHAALYTMDRPFGINWIAGEIIKQKDLNTLWEIN